MLSDKMDLKLASRESIFGFPMYLLLASFSVQQATSMNTSSLLLNCWGFRVSYVMR